MRERQIFVYKSSLKVIFMYFKRVFRLFWQLLSQIVHPPPNWPLPQSSRGGGTVARPSPLNPRLSKHMRKEEEKNVSEYEASRSSINKDRDEAKKVLF